MVIEDVARAGDPDGRLRALNIDPAIVLAILGDGSTCRSCSLRSESRRGT